MLESNIENREALVKEAQKERDALQAQLTQKEEELQNIRKHANNQDEVINRLKEHHTL